MFRRLSSFTSLLALSVAIASCGHQVTPNPATSDLSGDMVVKFAVDGAFDFTNVTYVIAIDTCGTGVPYPTAFLSGYRSYSYAFLIGGGTGTTALPELLQYYLNSGMFTKLAYPLNPSTTQLNANYNGTGTEFALTFPRKILNNPFGVPQPCPNSTAPAATAPTSLNSSTPSGVSVVTGVDVPPYLDDWTFNILTFTPNGTPIDSLGVYGPTDLSYPGLVIDTDATTTANFSRPQPYAVPASPSAYITYGEVDTYL